MRNFIKQKHRGFSFFFLAFAGLTVSIFICFYLIVQCQLEVQKYGIEDNITSSAMAAAMADLGKLSVNKTVWLQDKNTTYNTYCNCFKKNAGINASWNGPAGHPFFDFTDGKKIKVRQFIIYNVSSTPAANGHLYGERIIRNTNGSWSTTTVKFANYTGTDGSGNKQYSYVIKTPDNTTIQSTSIYVEMELPIHVHYFGIKATIRKSQTVAIATY